MTRRLLVALPLVLLSACAKPGVTGHPADAPLAPAAIWREPATRATPAIAPPTGPFRFLEEDFDGDSPKFLALDASGARWQVKLGPEAQAETVAVRLLDAMGFFVEETYLLQDVRVEGLEQLKRGRQFVRDTNTIAQARFEARRPEVRRGTAWDWADNPFVGSIEFDALRIMMVLFNNYDARTANNRILLVDEGDGPEARYAVTDVGASFGRYGGLGGTRTKNDAAGYAASRFIDHVSNGMVVFGYSTHPEGWARSLVILQPFYVAGERKKERDLRRVPVPAARWTAGRLNRLGTAAMRSAFEDAGYTADQSTAFMHTLTGRIAALSAL